MVQLHASGRLLALAEELLYEASNIVYMGRDIAEYRDQEDYEMASEVAADKEAAESNALTLGGRIETLLASPELDVEEDSEELIAWVEEFLDGQDEADRDVIERFYDYFPVER